MGVICRLSRTTHNRWGVAQLAERLAVNQEVGGSSPPAPVEERGCPAKTYGPVGLFSSGPTQTIASGERTRKRSPVSWSGLHRCQCGRSVCLLIDPLDGFHCLPSTRRCPQSTGGVSRPSRTHTSSPTVTVAPVKKFQRT
jgi:hypothetical protein